MAKANGNDIKRQKEIVSEWLELCAIENRKSDLAKELFALRGNEPFKRAGTTYRAVERVNTEAQPDGTKVEVSRTYSIRRLAEAEESL